MTNAPAGWYPDPDDARSMRWWNGESWGEQRIPADDARAATRRPRRTWIWAGGAALGFIVLAAALGIARAILILGIGLVVVGAIALAKGAIPWLRSRAWKIATVATGLALAIGGTAATAATVAPNASLRAFTGSASPDVASSPSPVVTSPPTPVVTTEERVVTEAIPFERANQDDANRDAGTTAIVVAGADGVRTVTYLVTYTDGRETGREIRSDVVTTQPVTEVTAVGTRQKPVAPVPLVGGGGPPAAGSGCHPSYAGVCVPIASDVDCAGGGGNGPAYVTGPVQVIGPDEYELDRDGDGIACDR